MMQYISHHGVKGQKWGIKNGPPYPLNQNNKTQKYNTDHSDAYVVDIKEANKSISKGIRPDYLREKHLIKKGTEVYRMTSKSDDNSDETTYISYLDLDRNFYKDGEYIQAIDDHGWPVSNPYKSGVNYEHIYKLKEDLVVPSRDELFKVVKNVVTDNNNSYNVVKEMSKYAGDYRNYFYNLKVMKGKQVDVSDLAYKELGNDFLIKNFDFKQFREDHNIRNETDSETIKIYFRTPFNWDFYSRYFTKDAQKIIKQKKGEITTQAYLKAIKSLTIKDAGYYITMDFVRLPYTRSLIIDELKRRGYNSMVDEAGVGVNQPSGADTLIVFNGKKSMDKITTNPIYPKERLKAYTKQRKYDKLLEKLSKNKKLSAQWSDIEIGESIFHNITMHGKGIE